MKKTMLILLSPFAPHIAEELWTELGRPQGILSLKWPEADPRAMVKETIEVVLQVNGKIRDRIEVPTGLSREEMEKLALESDQVRKHLEGKQILKVVVVPGRLINIAVR